MRPLRNLIKDLYVETPVDTEEEKFITDALIYGTAFMKGEFIDGEIVMTYVPLNEVYKYFNPALEGGLTTMEVSMKEEALKEHASAVEAAAGALYDAGFADGKGSVEVPVDTTPFAQEDIDKAVLDATEVLKAKVAELETQLSQKDADALEEAIADELAALAQKLRDRTVKAVEPVPVTEETKGTDAQP